MNEIAEKAVSTFAESKSLSDADFLVIKVNPELERISKHEIVIDMGGDRTTYFTDLQLPRKYADDFPQFFYVYLDERLMECKDDLINVLIDRAV